MKNPLIQSSYDELESELFAMREDRVLRLADAQRLIAWLDDPKRKPAMLAFTEGNERQIAYRFEQLLRGEYICTRCGLRKDADTKGAAPF